MIRGLHSFNEMAQLINMESDMIELVFQCGVCKKDFHNPDDLEEHLHHDEETDEASNEGNPEVSKNKALENNVNSDSSDDVEIVYVEPGVSSINQTVNNEKEMGRSENSSGNEDSETDKSVNMSKTQDKLHEASTSANTDNESDQDILCFYCGQLFDSYQKFRPHLKGHELNEAKMKVKSQRKVSKTRKRDQHTDPREQSLSTKEMPQLYRETLTDGFQVDVDGEEGKRQKSPQRKRKSKVVVDTVMDLSDLTLDRANDSAKYTISLGKQNQSYHERNRPKSPAKNKAENCSLNSSSSSINNIPSADNFYTSSQISEPQTNTDDIMTEFYETSSSSDVIDISDTLSNNAKEGNQQEMNVKRKKKYPNVTGTSAENQNKLLANGKKSRISTVTETSAVEQVYQISENFEENDFAKTVEKNQIQYLPPHRKKSIMQTDSKATDDRHCKKDSIGHVVDPPLTRKKAEKQHLVPQSKKKAQVQVDTLTSLEQHTDTSLLSIDNQGKSTKTNLRDARRHKAPSEKLMSNQNCIGGSDKETTKNINKDDIHLKTKHRGMYTQLQIDMDETERNVMSISIEMDKDTGIVKLNRKEKVTHKPQEKRKKVQNYTENSECNSTDKLSEMDRELNKEKNISKSSEKVENQHTKEDGRRTPQSETGVDILIVEQNDVLPLELNDVLPPRVDLVKATNTNKSPLKEDTFKESKFKAISRKKKLNLTTSTEVDEEVVANFQSEVLSSCFHPAAETENEAEYNRTAHRKNYGKTNYFPDIEQNAFSLFKPDTLSDTSNINKTTYVSEKQNRTSKAKNILMNPSKGKQVQEKSVALTDHELLNLYNIHTSIVKLHRVSLFQDRSKVNEVCEINEDNYLDKSISKQGDIDTNQGNERSAKVDKREGNKDDTIDIMETTCQVDRGVGDSVLGSSAINEVNEDSILERSSNNEINSELMMPTNCDKQPKNVITKRKKKRKKGHKLSSVEHLTKHSKSKWQKSCSESEGNAQNKSSGRDEREHNTDYVEGTVPDCLNTENMYHSKDISVSACDKDFTINEPAVTSPSTEKDAVGPDEIPEEEIEQSLFACGLGTTSPIYSSDSSPNKKSPGAKSWTSNSSKSPEPCKSIGRLFSRKKVARKSLPPFCWDIEYQPKHSKHKLRSLTKIERAFMNNPHSYFGKTSWLKHKFDSETDSDENWEVDLPIVDRPQVSTVYDNHSSSTEFNESLPTFPKNQSVNNLLAAHKLSSSAYSCADEADLMKKYGISEAKVVITKIIPTNLCLKSKQRNIFVDSDISVVHEPKESTDKGKTVVVENDSREKEIEINHTPCKKAKLTADCTDIDYVPKRKARKANRGRSRQYNVNDPTTKTHTLEVENSFNKVRSKYFQENSRIENLNSITGVDGVCTESLAGIVQNLRIGRSKQYPNKEQNEEDTIEKAHSLDIESPSHSNDTSVSNRKQLALSMPDILQNSIVPAFELNSNYSDCTVCQNKNNNKTSGAADAMIMHNCDHMLNKSTEAPDETLMHVTKDRKCSHPMDSYVSNCTNSLQSSVSAQDENINKDLDHGELIENATYCSRINSLTTSSESRKIIKGADLRMRWSSRGRGKRCHAQKTKGIVRRNIAKSHDAPVDIDAEKSQFESSCSSGIIEAVTTEDTEFVETDERVARERKKGRQEKVKQSGVKEIETEAEAPKGRQNEKRDEHVTNLIVDENISDGASDQTSYDPSALSFAGNQLQNTLNEEVYTVPRTDQSLADSDMKNGMRTGRKKKGKGKRGQLRKKSNASESIMKTKVHLNMDKENPLMDDSNNAAAKQCNITDTENNAGDKWLTKSEKAKNIAVEQSQVVLNKPEAEHLNKNPAVEILMKKQCMQQRSNNVALSDCSVNNQLTYTSEELMNPVLNFDQGKKSSDVNKERQVHRKCRGRGKRRHVPMTNNALERETAQMAILNTAGENHVSMNNSAYQDQTEHEEMIYKPKYIQQNDKEKSNGDLNANELLVKTAHIDTHCADNELLIVPQEIVNDHDLKSVQSGKNSDMKIKGPNRTRSREKGRPVCVQKNNSSTREEALHQDGHIEIEREIVQIGNIKETGEKLTDSTNKPCMKEKKIAPVTLKSTRGRPKKVRSIEVEENHGLINKSGPGHVSAEPQVEVHKTLLNETIANSLHQDSTDIRVQTTPADAVPPEDQMFSIPKELMDDEGFTYGESVNDLDTKKRGIACRKGRVKGKKGHVQCHSTEKKNVQETPVCLSDESVVIEIDISPSNIAELAKQHQPDITNEAYLDQSGLAELNNRVGIKKRGRPKKVKTVVIEESNPETETVNNNGIMETFEKAGVNQAYVSNKSQTKQLKMPLVKRKGDKPKLTKINIVDTSEDLYNKPEADLEKESKKVAPTRKHKVDKAHFALETSPEQMDLTHVSERVVGKRKRGRPKKAIGDIVEKCQGTKSDQSNTDSDIIQNDTCGGLLNKPEAELCSEQQYENESKKEAQSNRSKADKADIALEASPKQTELKQIGERVVGKRKREGQKKPIGEVVEEGQGMLTVTHFEHRSEQPQVKENDTVSKSDQSHKASEIKEKDISDKLLNKPEAEHCSKQSYERESKKIAHASRSVVAKAHIALEASPEQMDLTQISERVVGKRKRGRPKKAIGEIVEKCQGMKSDQSNKDSNIIQNDTCGGLLNKLEAELCSEQQYENESKKEAQSNRSKADNADIALKASPKQTELKHIGERVVGKRKREGQKKPIGEVVEEGQGMLTVTHFEHRSEQPQVKENDTVSKSDQSHKASEIKEKDTSDKLLNKPEAELCSKQSYERESKKTAQASRSMVDKAHIALEASPEQMDLTQISERVVGKRKRGRPKKAIDKVDEEGQRILTDKEFEHNSGPQHVKENDTVSRSIQSYKDSEIKEKDISGELLNKPEAEFCLKQPLEKESKKVTQTSRSTVDKAHIALEASPGQMDLTKISESGVGKRKRGRPKKIIDEVVKGGQGMLTDKEFEHGPGQPHRKENDISVQIDQVRFSCVDKQLFSTPKTMENNAVSRSDQNHRDSEIKENMSHGRKGKQCVPKMKSNVKEYIEQPYTQLETENERSEKHICIEAEAEIDVTKNACPRQLKLTQVKEGNNRTSERGRAKKLDYYEIEAGIAEVEENEKDVPATNLSVNRQCMPQKSEDVPIHNDTKSSANDQLLKDTVSKSDQSETVSESDQSEIYYEMTTIMPPGINYSGRSTPGCSPNNSKLQESIVPQKNAPNDSERDNSDKQNSKDTERIQANKACPQHLSHVSETADFDRKQESPQKVNDTAAEETQTTLSEPESNHSSDQTKDDVNEIKDAAAEFFSAKSQLCNTDESLYTDASISNEIENNFDEKYKCHLNNSEDTGQRNIFDIISDDLFVATPLKDACLKNTYTDGASCDMVQKVSTLSEEDIETVNEPFLAQKQLDGAQRSASHIDITQKQTPRKDDTPPLEFGINAILSNQIGESIHCSEIKRKQESGKETSTMKKQSSRQINNYAHQESMVISGREDISVGVPVGYYCPQPFEFPGVKYPGQFVRSVSESTCHQIPPENLELDVDGSVTFIADKSQEADIEDFRRDSSLFMSKVSDEDTIVTLDQVSTDKNLYEYTATPLIMTNRKGLKQNMFESTMSVTHYTDKGNDETDNTPRTLADLNQESILVENKVISNAQIVVDRVTVVNENSVENGVLENQNSSNKQSTVQNGEAFREEAQMQIQDKGKAEVQSAISTAEEKTVTFTECSVLLGQVWTNHSTGTGKLDGITNVSVENMSVPESVSLVQKIGSPNITKKQQVETPLQNQEAGRVSKNMGFSEVDVVPNSPKEMTQRENDTERRFNSVQNKIVPFHENSGLFEQQTANHSAKDIKVTDKSSVRGNENQGPPTLIEELEFEYLKELETIQGPSIKKKSNEDNTSCPVLEICTLDMPHLDKKQEEKCGRKTDFPIQKTADLQNMAIDILLVPDDSQTELFETSSKSNQTECLTHSKTFLEQICEGNERIDEIQLNKADEMRFISENQNAVLKDLNLPYELSDTNSALENLPLNVSDMNHETDLVNQNARKNVCQTDSVQMSYMKKEVKTVGRGRDWRKKYPKNIVKSLPEKSYHSLSPATSTDVSVDQKNFERESNIMSKGTQGFSNAAATFVAASTEKNFKTKSKKEYLQPRKDSAEYSAPKEPNFITGINITNIKNQSCMSLLNKKELGSYGHAPIDCSHNEKQHESVNSNLEALPPHDVTEDYLSHVIQIETDLTNVSVDRVNTNFKVQASNNVCKVWSNSIHEGIQSSREDAENQSEKCALIEQPHDNLNSSTSSVNNGTGMPKSQSKMAVEPVNNSGESPSGNAGSSSEVSNSDWPNDIVLAFSPLQLTLMERKKLAINRRKRRKSCKGCDRESSDSSNTFDSLLSEIGAMVDYEKQNMESKKENNIDILPRTTVSNYSDCIQDNTSMVSEVKTKDGSVCNEKNIKDISKSLDRQTEEPGGVFLDELQTNVTGDLVFGYDNAADSSSIHVLDEEKTVKTDKSVQSKSTDGFNMENAVKVLSNMTLESDSTPPREVSEDGKKLDKVQRSSVVDVESVCSVEESVKLSRRKRKKSHTDTMEQGKRRKLPKTTPEGEQKEKIASGTDVCNLEIRHNLTHTKKRTEEGIAAASGVSTYCTKSDCERGNLFTEHDCVTSLSENQTELMDKSFDETNTLSYQSQGLSVKSFEDAHANENVEAGCTHIKGKNTCVKVVPKNQRKKGRPKKHKAPNCNFKTENYPRAKEVNIQKMNTFQEEVSSNQNRQTSMKDSWKEKTVVNYEDYSNKDSHLANHDTVVNVCSKSAANDFSETIDSVDETTKSTDHLACEVDKFVPGTIDATFPGKKHLQCQEKLQGPLSDQFTTSSSGFRRKKFGKTIAEICSKLNNRHFEETITESENVLSGNFSVSFKAKGKQKKARNKNCESSILSEEKQALRKSKNAEIIKQSQNLTVKLVALTEAEISKHCRRFESTSRLSETDVISPSSEHPVFAPLCETMVPDPSLSRDLPSVMSVDGEQIIEQALDMYDDHCNATNSTDKDSVTEHGSTSTLFDLIESVKDSDGSIYTDDLCDNKEPHGSNIDSDNILSELLTSPLSGEELSTFNSQVRNRSISSETDEEMAAYCDSGEDLLEENIVVMNDDKMESEHFTSDGVDRFGCVRGNSEEMERDTCKSSHEFSREGSVEHIPNVSRISNNVNNISYQLKKVCGKLTSDRIDSFDVRKHIDKQGVQGTEDKIV